MSEKSYAQPKELSPYLIDTTVVLKRGIYKTFEEFVYNRPSELTPFVIKEKQRTYKLGNTYTHYQLEFLNKEDQDRISGSWGFCDGERVYKSGNSREFGKDNYDKFECLGRYCVYNEFTFAYGANGVSPGSGNNVYPKILDITNRKIYSFTLSSVKKLISSD
ncbi:MAG TPA: hypothetical protein VNB90_03210 [Cytophagaceae bacterium]|nr:hypothetical protein [Cytophagaceae bacterium]